MKRLFIHTAAVLLTILFTGSLKAQLKIHDNNQVSLGSLTKTNGVQVRS